MNNKNTLSITEARKRIFEIAEDAQIPGQYYTLTENGKPKIVMMSASEYDSIVETMELLADSEVLNDLKKAETDYKRGNYTSLDEIKKELGCTELAFMVADKSKKLYKTKTKKSGNKTKKK